MLRDEQLSLIRQRCYESRRKEELSWQISLPVIHLSDVLRAVEHHATLYKDLPLKMQLDNVQKIYGQVCAFWALRKSDSITEQHEECLTFLADLFK